MRKIIENVPLVKQKPFWCGYTCLSMVLKHWGYDYSPDDVFDKAFTEVHGELDITERYTQAAAIGIGNLVLAARKLSPLRTDLWDKSKHDKMQGIKPGYTPQHMLRTYLSNDIPCIVRLPNHYNVAIGFDTDADSVIFNETNGHVVERPTERFERSWSDFDQSMPYDTRYLMLALRSPERLNQH